MNKKVVVSIVAVIAIIALLGVFLVACNADSYKSKLEKKGYTVSTYTPDDEDDDDIEWGLMASKGAGILGGDYVIIVNAEKVALTGKKWSQKMYYRHSGYPGGLKTRTATEMLDKQPQKIVEKAVRGMLPNGKLGDDMYRRLYVYVGPNHPHAAQKPEVMELK